MEKRLETALSIYDKTIYHTGAVSPADLISRLSFLLKIRPFFVLLFLYFLIYALTAGENKCCVPEKKKEIALLYPCAFYQRQYAAVPPPL